MKRPALATLLTGLVAVGLGACDDKNPVIPPQDQDPVIDSVRVFPTSIGRADSVVVICNATDPDGDPLVYDWETDGRLTIKGSASPYRYNTFSNAQIFYPNVVNSPLDTAWVECSARDRRGGSDARVIRFEIHQ
jgi:hypothetical protein